jgi:catechol O-methyltransferase
MLERTKSHGPLKFHKNTEQELLKYVLANAETNNISSVIQTIDDFCWNNHWMMHVGDEKGVILEQAILNSNPMNVLELGTYCGYSCLRILRNMSKEESNVYTIDPNEDIVNLIAKPILSKAGVLDRVVFLSGYSSQVIPNIKNIVFDAVFFDHEKKQYHPDLLLLEEHGLVGKQTTLIADNVIVFNIHEYLNYVSDKNKFVTTIKYTKLEYNSEKDKEVYTDGVVVSNYV